MLSIIAHHKHYLAVSKPIGVICQDERGNSRTVMSLLRLIMPGIEARGVHRLDAQVSGTVLLGLTDYGTRSLAKCFKTRTIRKSYLAVLRGHADLDDEGTTNALEMKTEWSIIRTIEWPGRGRLFLVWLYPREGRKHQLRIHAANALGCPILFDMRYPYSPEYVGTRGRKPDLRRRVQDGWTMVEGEGVALHCAKMSFPLGLERHCVSCVPPDIGIWRDVREMGVDLDAIIEAAT